jgi:hypothetical protein
MKQFGKGKTLLQLIPRKEFDELCTKWNIDKKVRKLTTWEQVCTHVMAYVIRLESLREIEAVLGVPRSTFSDANKSRCSGFFQELCEVLITQVARESRDRKIKRALKQLFVIDSTECRSHGSMSTTLPLWQQRASLGKKKASFKVHTVWNVGDEWVDDFIITPNRVHDGKACFKFAIKPDRIYVFDKAYHDIRFWLKIVKNGSHFVTRLKESPARRKLGAQVLKESGDKDGVLWEGSCSRAYSNLLRLPKDERNVNFRHIIYRDPESKRIFDFATSDFKSSGQEIADTYKKRWAVELLFKWLKGHLNIRYFASKNVNAIEIQVAIAVLVQLLVRQYREKNRQVLTPWQCLRNIRVNLIHQSLSENALHSSIGSKYFARAALNRQRYAG